MLRVKIETDNDAFSVDGEQEVARLLRQVADRVARGELDGSVRDCNGNRCGAFDLRLKSYERSESDE